MSRDTSHRLQSQQADQTQDEKKESSEVTLEEIKADLNVMADTDALSAEELLARGKQYENGEGCPYGIPWHNFIVRRRREQVVRMRKQLWIIFQDCEEVCSHKVKMHRESFFIRYRAGVTAGQNGDYAPAYASAYDNVFFFNDPENEVLAVLRNSLKTAEVLSKM